MLTKFVAARFIKILESGRTSPILLECEAADNMAGALGTFVVKARGLPEVSDYELFVETLAYLLAQELDVETPRAVLVELSQDFADLINPILKRSGLSVEEGLAFGSELVPGAVPVTGSEYLNPDQLEKVLNIFCFDSLALR